MSNVPALLRAWPSLPAPTLADLETTLRAEFAAPLRQIAPAGLGLVGLPRWHGKRFTRSGPDELTGVNLTRAPGGRLEERLPMRAVLGRGVDDRPSALVLYAADGPRPWRWIRDELRLGPDGDLVGLSYVDSPGLRRCGLPFLLRR